MPASPCGPSTPWSEPLSAPRSTEPISRSLNTSIDTTSSANTMHPDTMTTIEGLAACWAISCDPHSQPSVVPSAEAPLPRPNTRTGDNPDLFETWAHRHHTTMMKHT